MISSLDLTATIHYSSVMATMPPMVVSTTTSSMVARALITLSVVTEMIFCWVEPILDNHKAVHILIPI